MIKNFLFFLAGLLLSGMLFLSGGINGGNLVVLPF